MRVEPIAVLRAYLHAGDSEDYDAFESVFDPGVEVHTAAGGTSRGIAAQKDAWTAGHAGLSSLTHQLVEALSDGDRVSARLVVSGFHTGSFLGIPPTGRTVQVDQALFARVTEGRIVEMWEITDTGSGLRQFGVLGGQAISPGEDQDQ